MDTEQLEAFDRIAREGSFGRAALTLGIAQPTISARIQALEREVGGELFERRGRGSSLTQFGETFLPYARRTLSVLVEGVEISQATRDGRSGRISVGILESYATGFFARALSRFHDSHPEVKVFVRTGHSPQVLEMLRDGIVRMGLLTWPQVAGDVEVLLRIREPLVAVARPGSRLAEKETVSLGDLVNQVQPFYRVAWSPQLADTIDRVSQPPDSSTGVPVLDVPAMTAQHLIVDSGGASILPRAAVEEDLSSGRLAEVGITDADDLVLSGALVRLKGAGRLPPASRAVLGTLRSTVAELPLN